MTDQTEAPTEAALSPEKEAAIEGLVNALESAEDADALTVAAIAGDIHNVVRIVEKYPAILHQDMIAETAAWMLEEQTVAQRRAALLAARLAGLTKEEDSHGQG